MMHGADGATPVTLVENASRPDQRILASRLDCLPGDLTEAGLLGPVLMLYGIAPARAAAPLPALIEELA